MNFIEFSAPIEYHTTLNPKIWEHTRMKSSVRGALLRIAQDFTEYIDVPFKVLDIVITGGNANYNYTTHSDIDLHLITDYSQVVCDRAVAELFDAKRLLYKSDYDINIHGIPVELYVEDRSHPAVSSSYSIIKQSWIKEPTKDMPEYDRDEVEHMVGVWTTVLQQAIKTGDLQTCRHAVELLRRYRKLGLNTAAAEFSTANLVYKSLRNEQVLKSVFSLIDRLHDQDLSI